MPRFQVLEKSPSFGSEFSKKFGTGLGEGVSEGLQTRLDRMLKANEVDITPQDMVKTASSFLTKGQLSEIPLEDWQKISDNANRLKYSQGPQQAIFSAIKDFLPKEEEEEIPIYSKKELEDRKKETENQKKSLLDIFRKRSERSISGRIPSILRGEGEKELLERTELEDPTFLERLSGDIGELAGDLPYFLAGGKAGSLIGAPVGTAGRIVGGSAGALAFPAMIKTALSEYQKYIDRGEKGSFEDFLRSADRIAEEGLISGSTGIMLSGLGKLAPSLKKIPKIKKLFEMKGVGKTAEKTAAAALQSSGLLAQQAAATGEIPTAENVADTFTQVLGFNLAHINPKIFGKIAKRIKNSGKSPSQVAEELKEKYSPEDLKKDSELFKAVKDVTGEPSKEERVAREKISRISPEEAEKERRKIAEKIAKSPIKVTLEKEEKKKKAREKPLTERETQKREKASADLRAVEKKIDKVSSDIKFLKEKLAEPGRKDRSLLEHGLRSKEKQLIRIENEKKDLQSIEKTGRKAFIQERTELAAEKRIKELETLSRDLESKETKEMEKLFERDQKYIDSLQKMLRSGIFPDSKMVHRGIRELDIYKKAYESAIRDLENRKREVSDPAILKRINGLQKLLKKNLDINSAKIELQKQRKESLSRMKGPGTSFLRQMIKNLRTDIPQMQKDILKYKKFVDSTDMKSREAFERAQSALEKYRKNPSKTNLKGAAKQAEATEKEIKENVPTEKEQKSIDKLAQEYIKNPTSENLEKLSRMTGLSPAEIQSMLKGKMAKKLEKIFEEAVDKKKKGESNSKIAKFFKKEMDEFLKKRTKKIGMALGGALLFAPLKNFIKEETGTSIPYSTFFFLLPFTRNVRYGSTAMAFLLEKAVAFSSLKKQRKEYQSLSTPQERIRYRKKLKKEGATPSKIKKIVEKKKN